MQKYYVPAGSVMLTADSLVGYHVFYDASDVDARIAELEKGLQAALRWLDAPVSKDVVATELPPHSAGFSGEYLNDLADMRAAARSL